MTASVRNGNIGYARVRAPEQRLDAQFDVLKQAAWGKTFSDPVGGMEADRLGWDSLMVYVRPGDTVVVTELSRLSRSLMHLIAALVVGLFLTATLVPRFGTVGHRHDGGRVPHLHLSRSTPPDAHHHQGYRHRRHQQTAPALPFGGEYARPTSTHDHPSPRSGDDSSQSRDEVWTQANLHWHFYDGSFPPEAVVILVLGLLFHYLYLVNMLPLSFRSQTHFDIQPRGPPA